MGRTELELNSVPVWHCPCSLLTRPLAGLKHPSLPIDSSFFISAVLSHTWDRQGGGSGQGWLWSQKASGQCGMELWLQEYFRDNVDILKANKGLESLGANRLPFLSSSHKDLGT